MVAHVRIKPSTKPQADSIYRFAEEWLVDHEPEAFIDMHQMAITITTQWPRDVTDGLIEAEILDPAECDFEVDA